MFELHRQVDVENVTGSHGRHCHHQRRQLHPPRGDEALNVLLVLLPLLLPLPVQLRVPLPVGSCLGLRVGLLPDTLLAYTTALSSSTASYGYLRLITGITVVITWVAFVSQLTGFTFSCHELRPMTRETRDAAKYSFQTIEKRN